MFIFWLFHQFITKLYTHASQQWNNLNRDVTIFVELAD